MASQHSVDNSVEKSAQGRTLSVLVAGGAGFIGSHLCEKYLGLGYRVFCVDNLQTTRTPKNIEHLFSNPRFFFFRHDITKPFDFKEKIDWIFNCACSGSYTSYQYNPVHTMQTNTVGMINVLELARKHGARVLQTSTSEIYGDPLESPQSEEYRGNVNILGPRACYDEGKRAAETLCMDYHREYGVDVKIVRIFNTYGPKMDLNDGRAMTNFIVNALDGKDLVIYGDGTHTRSFQYVSDLIEGLDRMMRKEHFIGPVNLGNPEKEVSMKALAELIIRETGSRSKIIFEEKATDDPKQRRPDISRAKSELGWEPKVPLEEGVRKVLPYFKALSRPDKRILVFTTTYHPVMGPAERALHELSLSLPDTEFHIITTRFKRGLPSRERFAGDLIHRVGFGIPADKFLLPILGPIVTLSLHRRYRYHFAWSVMASYGGLAALVMKFFHRDINFLVTLDSLELAGRNTKARLFLPFYRAIFKNADSVYVSDLRQERSAKIVHPDARVALRRDNTADFLNQIRHTYAALINAQEQKLARPR